jgi:FkbM family methyltransferase
VINRLLQRAKTVIRRVLPQPVYAIYRRWRVACLVKHYVPHQVSHVYGGTSLRVELADRLAEGWYDRDWPSLPELEILRRTGLAAGCLVLDIGAHQGVLALLLAAIVGPDGRVIAIEAEPHNARAAERNCELNGANNVTVVHAAAAAEGGTLRFAEGLNGHVVQGRRPWGTVEVAAISVDDLAEQYGHPGCIVIDVEGFEASVLAGARETIRRASTLFLVEVHVGHGLDRAPQRVAACFGPGYRLLAAPEPSDGNPFRDYREDSFVNQSRFFLVAVPESTLRVSGADEA